MAREIDQKDRILYLDADQRDKADNGKKRQIVSSRPKRNKTAKGTQRDDASDNQSLFKPTKFGDKNGKNAKQSYHNDRAEAGKGVVDFFGFPADCY